MATFDYYFELGDVPAGTYGYHPPIADASSNYTVIMKTGDTVNVRTVYAGSATDANDIRYIPAPNMNQELMNPDAPETRD